MVKTSERQGAKERREAEAPPGMGGQQGGEEKMEARVVGTMTGKQKLRNNGAKLEDEKDKFVSYRGDWRKRGQTPGTNTSISISSIG